MPNPVRKPVTKPKAVAAPAKVINVKAALSEIDPKVKMSDDAVELLNDYIVKLF